MGALDDLEAAYQSGGGAAPASAGVSALDALESGYQSSLTLSGGATQGAKDFIPNLLSSPKSIWNILKGVDTTKRAVTDAAQTFSLDPIRQNKDVIEGTLRGVGGISSGVAGAGVGAMAGAPLAPFTFGASVPIGAALGFGAGMLGFNKLNQATGSDEPTTPQKDLYDLGYNSVQALGGELTAKGAKAAANKITSAAPELARKLENSALGTRQSDFTMSQRRDGLIKYDYVPDGEGGMVKVPLDKPTTRLAQSLEQVKQEGVLDTSWSPGKVAESVQTRMDDLGKQVGSIISSYDDLPSAGVSVPKVYPTFDKAKNYIDNIAEAPLKQELRGRLKEWENAIKTEGDGSLGFLQRQKIQLGKKTYAAGKEHVQELNAAIVDDMRTAIEKATDSQLPPEAAGAVKGLNQRLSALYDVQGIIDRTVAAAESANSSGFWSNFFKTTGGSMAGGILGAQVGGPVGAALGMAGSAAARALTSPRGKVLQANVLKGSVPAANLFSQGMSVPGVGGGIFSQANRDKNETRSQPSATQQQQQSARTPVPTSPAQKNQEVIPSFNPTAASGATQAPLDQAISLMKSSYRPDMSKQNPNKFEARLMKAGLDIDGLEPLDLAQIKAESSGVANIEGPKTKYGTAKGLMQLLDSTGKEWHKKLKLEGKYDPFDPYQNLVIGKAYREYLVNRYDGDTRLGLAAYNWGLGNLDKLIARSRTGTYEEIRSSLPSETRKYVDKIMREASGGMVRV